MQWCYAKLTCSLLRPIIFFIITCQIIYTSLKFCVTNSAFQFSYENNGKEKKKCPYKLNMRKVSRNSFGRIVKERFYSNDSHYRAR
jgi:hypothetical protein